MEERRQTGTHGIRRGVARAMLGWGGSSARLLEAGQWRSSAYRLFLDLGAEEGAAAARVLIESSDAEGPGERALGGKQIPGYPRVRTSPPGI